MPVTAARGWAAALALAACAAIQGAAGAASPVPAVTPGSVPGRGAFTVVLHGAVRAQAAPEAIPGAIIVPVPGVLRWRSSVVRYPHPVPGVADIVVAQHDPRTIWVVAHLTGGPVPAAVRSADGAVRITFGSAAGAAAPEAARFSVRWDHTPAADAAAQLTLLSGVRVAVAPGVSGVVTLAVDDAPLDAIVRAVAAQLHARAVRDGHAYRIAP